MKQAPAPGALGFTVPQIDWRIVAAVLVLLAIMGSRLFRESKRARRKRLALARIAWERERLS